jgi:hypothetical protein
MIDPAVDNKRNFHSFDTELSAIGSKGVLSNFSAWFWPEVHICYASLRPEAFSFMIRYTYLRIRLESHVRSFHDDVRVEQSYLVVLRHLGSLSVEHKTRVKGVTFLRTFSLQFLYML